MGRRAIGLSAARRFDSEFGEHRGWFGKFREIYAHGGDQCTRQRRSGSTGSEQGAGGRGAVEEISGCAGAIKQRALAITGSERKLSAVAGDGSISEFAGAT